MMQEQEAMHEHLSVRGSQMTQPTHGSRMTIALSTECAGVRTLFLEVVKLVILIHRFWCR